jgi:hypothetical protein
MNINELCMGCILFDTCVVKTSNKSRKRNKVKYCPCTTCLVKVTCNTDTSCDEYEAWIKVPLTRFNQHQIRNRHKIQSQNNISVYTIPSFEEFCKAIYKGDI